MKASIRRSLGLESEATVIASSDEPSDIVGVDVAELFGEADGFDQTLGDDAQSKMLNDVDEVITITDVLEGQPDTPLTDAALQLAQESLNAIFSRYGVKTRSISTETIDGKRMTAKEVIAYATEAVDEMSKKQGESLDSLFKRMTSEVDYVTRTKNSWRNQAVSLRRKASAVTGDPSDAKYTNRVMIAHMTKGDKTVLKSAAELQNIVTSMQKPVDGMVLMLKGVSSTFSSFLNQSKGAVDFDRVAASFEKSHFFPGSLSLTGPEAIFGEETIMEPVSGFTDNLSDMMGKLKRATITHNKVWELSDLGDISLPAKTVQEIQKEADLLVKIGEEINKQFVYFNGTVKPFVWELRRNFLIPYVNTTLTTWHAYTSPIKFLRYRIRYSILLWKLVNAAQRIYRHNTKAASSMLAYYEWSLKQVK